ncbi:MAG: hypothetical protein WCE52_19900 [Candidatus Acidiferrum sp.]
MVVRVRVPSWFGILVIGGWVVVCLAGSFSGTAGARTARDSTAKTQSSQDSTTRAQSSGAKPTDKTVAVAEIPRGMKLMLKDGTYQVVREYKRDGERVRYYSLERGDWEEIPASMIDWDATEKTKTDDEKTTAALVDKVHKQEEAKRIDNVADVDASLQVGKGAFLPTGEGMFVVEGKTIRLVEQVDSQIKTDKTRAIEQVLSPVPIVPGKKNVVIAGSHAKLRLRTRSPEFYLREAPEDPEHVTRIERSSRPGESGPEVVLLRAKVTRNGRQFQTIRSLFGEELSRDSSEVALQRWEVAPTVYRFTLGEPLTPGEYVLAEVLPDGLNMFVWDFGLDEAGGGDVKK